MPIEEVRTMEVFKSRQVGKKKKILVDRLSCQALTNHGPICYLIKEYNKSKNK